MLNATTACIRDPVSSICTTGRAGIAPPLIHDHAEING